MFFRHQANILLTFALCALPNTVTAQTDDDVIVISQGSDDYVFQYDDKGRLEVKNRQTTTYTAERRGGRVQPFVFYGGTIEIDRASATGFSTAQYKSAIPENIFFDDSKVCYFNLDIPRKGKSVTARFERTFHDPKLLTRIPLDDTHFVRQKTVSVTLPEGYRIVERQMTPHISRTRTIDKQGRETVVYTVTDQPCLKREPLMPDAQILRPTLFVVGAFKDATDLYRWGHAQEQVDCSLPQQDSLIATITHGCSTDKACIASTLAWVQQNIRYVAYEAGQAAFTPDKPSEVIRKRYGDCKGMSLLLKTLLKAQGFDARLADIGVRGLIDWTADEVPTPAAYNHVICVLFHQGDTLFLDATIKSAPMGFIPAGLQGQQACVENGDDYLMLTVPELPSAASTDSLHYEAQLVDDALHIKADAEWWGDMKAFVVDGFHSTRADEQGQFADNLLNAKDRHRTVGDCRWEWGDTLRLSGVLTDRQAVTASAQELYVELDPHNDYMATPIDTTKRQNDVELPFRFRSVRQVSFAVPDTMTVKWLPKGCRLETPIGLLACSFSMDGSRVVFRKVMEISQRRLRRDQLPLWNEALKQWSEASIEQLVLTKK